MSERCNSSSTARLRGMLEGKPPERINWYADGVGASLGAPAGVGSARPPLPFCRPIRVG